jgi:hypothetical protein
VKKKGILILGMLVVCFLLQQAASSWQGKMYNKITAVGESGSTKTGASDRNALKEIDAGTASLDSNGSPPVAKEPAAYPDKSTDSVEKASANTGSKIGSNNTTKAKTSTPSSKAPSTNPEKPNLIITDTINNKTILTVRTSFNGQSVYDITARELSKAGIDYKSNVTKDYIRSISGRTEKSPEASSGWVYYVNGRKAGIGAKNYIPKDTDIIEWKFWKDALNN